MNFKEINNLLENGEKIPYPEVTCVQKDYNFGKNLYDSYAGTHGELTAITQYIYEHIKTGEEKELSNILLRISIQEMHHLDILGSLLVDLGFIPYYMGKYNNKWCSNNVTYKFYSIEEMLKMNIEGEKIAIKEYERLISITKDDKIKMLIARIIMDEQLHIKIFSELLKDCK